jgi:hypothetical protein
VLFVYHVDNHGKCVSSTEKIKVRNKKTGEIEELPIKEFFERFKK